MITAGRGRSVGLPRLGPSATLAPGMNWRRRSSLPPRVAIIQRELDRFERPRYLEIGVHTGTVLLNVRARVRVGVDPHKRIRWRQLAIRPRLWRTMTFLEKTSDRFFADLDRDAKFDVIFIDGYHSYGQALSDVENSLRHLAPNGVVMLHDCNPPSAAAAALDPATVPELEAGDGWCGDVWKAIVHLRATRPDLQVEVLDADFGIGLVREARTELLAIDPASIATLDYAALARDRERLLGLRSA